jgi:hypothetical protein
VFILIVLAAAAYLLATTQMEALVAYRSPLAANPPRPGDALLPDGGTPATRKVVFVLIDGLRLDTSLDAQVMPALASLRQQGASAEVHSQPPSYSAPAYTVLFSGAWPDLSDGHPINQEYPDIRPWTQDDLFSAAARRGLKTAAAGFNWFERMIPAEALDASFFTPGYDAAADRQVVDAALPWLEGGDYQFVLIHLDQVDTAGHYEGGPRDPRWNAAASRADSLLADIAAHLDLSQDTLVVTSDHGQIDRGGHGGHEEIVLRQPLVLAGAGVNPGIYPPVEQVDLAPTLAALLGTNIPASSQGHVLSAMLTLPKAVEQALPQALQAQQKALLEAYKQATGAEILTPLPDPDPVSATQEALAAARMQRLARERYPRAFVAVLLALLPLYWLRRSGWREARWLLLAGFTYLGLFYLLFAVLAGKTFSLSSVDSPTDLLLTAALCSLAAFSLAGLLVSLLRSRLGHPPQQPLAWALDLALIVAYLLALPALWSIFLNGPWTTWTLPDLASMFIGFISLIQILFTALLGLLAAGLLAARLSWRRRTASRPGAIRA